MRARTDAVVYLYLNGWDVLRVSKECRVLPPVTLLTQCAAAFEANALYIRMNSIAFSKKREELLRNISTMCKEEPPKTDRRGLFAEDEEMCDFLGAMFAMPYTKEERTEWPNAYQMLCDLIEQHGDEELKKVRACLDLLSVNVGNSNL